MSTWFIVDLIAMIPFDLILISGSINRIARFARIGKLYRFIRFLKMVRVLKVVQVRNTFFKKFTEKLKVNIGLERLLFLLFLFFVLLHVAACLW